MDELINAAITVNLLPSNYHLHPDEENAIDKVVRAAINYNALSRTQPENKPLSLEELRKMNQRAIWWWNKSAQAQLTICSFKQFNKTPNFISFDWNEQDCTEAFSYEKLIRYGYKPYARKPKQEEK